MSDGPTSPIALVFPGQGSQSAGMLAGYGGHPSVAAAVEEASEAIGVNLAAIIEDEAALNDTRNTQPALLAVCVGVYRAAASHLPPAALFAGHSLGEYTALVCADAIDFSEAVRLVRLRGEVMQRAVAKGMGGMAAILGASSEVVSDSCAEVRERGGQVWAANYNSPQQTVIAGLRESVEECRLLLQQRGIKRAVEVPMSVPSHCPLMLPAAEAMTAALREVEWRAPSPPVLHNAMVDIAADLAAALAAQLTQPVRWTDTVLRFAAEGVMRVYECGPGRVLCGLGKRIAPDLPHFSLAGSEDLARLEASSQ